MKNIIKNKVTIVLFLFILFGCTEPYALQTDTFENALVVEATITNELKIQKIKISRTYTFEESQPTMEKNAQVSIVDEDGTAINFSEAEGNYVSDIAFQAIPGKVYKLNIKTSDGKIYRSESETLTNVNPMQDVVASAATRDGDRGVRIDVKSFDPLANSKFYRYEYEETYKIISPTWANEKAILGPDPLPGEYHEILIVPKDPNTRICYGTQVSNDILQTSTAALPEDRVNFPVRFIGLDNYIISHRYSILVRQYVQNIAAYTFYETLKKISGSGTLFSPTQPGFFYGNIKSADNPDEKVIGFFEVSSVSEKRIFFNFTDLFPNDPLPPYYVDCELTTFNYCFNRLDPECTGPQLVSSVGQGILFYYYGTGPLYTLVPPPCADCTTFASNVIPSFWE